MRDSFQPALGFNFLTPWYDFGCELLGYGKSFKEKIIKISNIKKNDKILDVGSGTGTLIIQIKAKYPNVEIIGVDPDQKINQIAKEKLAKNKISARIVSAYAQGLPFNDNYFDLVISILTFHHLKTDIKTKAIQEIYRVLKPHGRFIMADFGKTKSIIGKVLLNFGGLFEDKESMKANLGGLLPKMLKNNKFKVRDMSFNYRGIQTLEAEK